ncbi:MAG: hypothetical protein FJW39_34115, partial [Acidobacteria bacterium]|nr:hypothetical protein [Acidobacteriota bacterium]
MPLSVGDKLGPYEVVSSIGAGGMGEVYKARDTRLDRTVAIKVLPEHIAKRDDLRARFEREARTVASLNHPNICVLHDIGPGYMVMELIEGESLAARIEKGAIPLDQALLYATQITDALDRAHRAGVTHRDVKPQNIMLTRDGVKVLDFGLAKSQAKPGPTDETLTAVLTSEGTIMGTPQYMAPEQFGGKEADARSDIWAFGAVLYEMVTGRKAFHGSNYQSLVGAILATDPAPMAVKPFTPAWLERLVRRCLQKDPDDRWQTMRDIVIELRSPPEAAPAVAKRSRRWQAVAAVFFIAAVTGWGLWLRGGVGPALPVATTIEPPEGGKFAPIVSIGGSAISPNGRMLAFVATDDKGESLLYVRPLESLAARALAGTEDAGRPFWSPDSKSLGFIAQNKLKRIDLAGGAPTTLCDAGAARGGDWNEEGVILFGTNSSEGTHRIPASGGTSALVTRVNQEARERFHYYPQFLPGGREFLYLVRHNDPAKSGIAIGSLETGPGEAKPAVIVAQTEFGARYDAASRRLLYIPSQGQGTLMARRLELNPARLVGDPVVVAEGLRSASNNGYADFSVSRQGTLFYGQGTGSNKLRFGWRDRPGKSVEMIGEPVEAWSSFRLSPDGMRVAYSAGPNQFQSDVWVMDLERGLSTRISFNKGAWPRWSPDGRFVYYNNGSGIYRKPADGSGEEVLLAKAGLSDFVNTVSPDGKALLFGYGDLMKLALSGGNAVGEARPEPYLKTSFFEGAAAFSPDGRWVAYNSNESGRSEVYIQGYPDKRGKWLVSAAGGFLPTWRADGKELYWGGPDGAVIAAGIELAAHGVRPGRPQPLFRLPVVDGFPHFQTSRDGQRFLVYEPAGGPQRELP